MASVQTSSYGGRYLKLTVVEESTSIPNNTSTVKWTLESIGGSANYYTIYNCSVVVNGQTVYNPGTVQWSSQTFPAAKGSKSGTITVNHKSDGSADPISFTLHGKVFNSGDEAVSGSLSLSTIPRYATITSFSVSKRNETSVIYNFTYTPACDHAKYSTDNGATWHDLPTSNIVSGLSPNTTYNFKLQVKRTDSQLWTTSGTVAQTTYKAPSQSLKSKTETSITMNWSIDSTANHIWYSKDNGANWVDVGNVNATSGSYTISGLSANTSYNIKTRVRRSASSTTYDTSASSQTTYDYPYCTESPNFTIGNALTLKFYNPLSRTITVSIVGDDNSEHGTDQISGTSLTGYNNTGWCDWWYSTIPNSQNGKYKVKVTYGSIVKTRANNNTYAVTGNEIPTFSDFTYRDSNSIVSSVTGNDQVMVKGLSTVEVTVPSADKMVANNSATPNNYVMSIATLSGSIAYDSADVVKDLGIINAIGTQRLNVVAYDSRGLNKTVYKDITVYDYVKPVINATITRLNNFEAQTTIKVSGTYTKLTIDNVNKNSITSVKYRYRETGGSWSNWVNLTTTLNNGTFTCSDVVLALDITKSFEFEIQATDSLEQVTTTPVNVDIGQAIFFVSSNNRACYINGQQLIMYDVVDTW